MGQEYLECQTDLITVLIKLTSSVLRYLRSKESKKELDQTSTLKFIGRFLEVVLSYFKLYKKESYREVR